MLKALVALVPVSLLLVGLAVLFSKFRTVPTFLLLIGLFLVGGWGLPGSAGHYLDLVSAVLGLSLLLIGYLWHALRSPHRWRTRLAAATYKADA